MRKPRGNHEENGGAKRFYPHVPKLELFSLGYIATHSRHSTGNAVDLTLIKLPPAKAAPFERAARYGPCTAPAEKRAPDNSIDMGTGFDCLDEKSATHSRPSPPRRGAGGWCSTPPCASTAFTITRASGGITRTARAASRLTIFRSRGRASCVPACVRAPLGILPSP